MFILFATLQDSRGIRKDISILNTILYGTIRHLGDTGEIGTVRSYFLPPTNRLLSPLYKRVMMIHASLPSHVFFSANYLDLRYSN